MKATSQIILALAAVAALAGGVFMAVRSLPQDNPPVRIVLPDEAPTSQAELKVYVTGAVDAPGVYTLPDGARLADAIDAAGGAASNANLGAVNLALRVKDEDYWRIPELRDAPELAQHAMAAETRAAVNGVNGAAHPSTRVSPSSHANGHFARLDINAAQVDSLKGLPGIGEVRAHAIVRYREQYGAFAGVNDLANVPGIGPALLEGLRDLVEAR